VGNGYFGIRGANEECAANPVNYPGMYMAGLFNRIPTLISGRDIYNEDFVNAPNSLCINWKIGSSDWFDFNSATIVYYYKNLNFKTG